MSWQIKVPATTANIGAGFDSIGIALNTYLMLEVEEAHYWSFHSNSSYLAAIPSDKNNFIYKIVEQTAVHFGKKPEQLKPCRVELKSDIPLARGLGSSATAIAAGIELANLLLDLRLPIEEKIRFATELEGHPDNVVPAILGGCVIGHYDGELNYSQIKINQVAFLTIIPTFQLKTKDARAVLPVQFDYHASVAASSVANVSVAALYQSDWPLLGRMLKKDLFHQPYRKKLIPHYDELELLLTPDVYGVYLSGAGPTLIALANPADIHSKIAGWRAHYDQFEWRVLEADNEGLTVTQSK
ncbi:homoserine kinase [Amphibacillus marinus]|uniref:Homoserine kinase n=1 Tax=Amphibacillus marinus TaxID=872970 RepID=A0A1H8RZK9_9BACI|nr:homoserine kinase [Amphibacillus marinus]SEO71772.1 homoserine kinase [Amphibacillus marinus]